jgi:flavin-binding protein dodecin
MSIVKVIEVISEGATVDAALKSAVEEAAKTVQNIRQINVEHIEGLVENNKITKIRINAKLSFLVDHSVSG